MRRRTLLAIGGSALSLSVAGCLDAPGSDLSGTQVEPLPGGPDVDCSESSRPQPEPQDGEDLVQPAEYPGPPPVQLDEESAIEYVQRFEEAYRTNKEISQTDRLHWVSVSVVDTWTYDAPEGAAVVRLRTHFSGTAETEEAEGELHYDIWDVYVTYYVDPTLIVRAEKRNQSQVDTAELDPDPFESGEPVACFD